MVMASVVMASFSAVCLVGRWLRLCKVTPMTLMS